MDVERIIQMSIPDIAPVYGGVRGATARGDYISANIVEICLKSYR